jgi:hypothetical protein
MFSRLRKPLATCDSSICSMAESDIMALVFSSSPKAGLMGEYGRSLQCLTVWRNCWNPELVFSDAGYHTVYTTWLLRLLSMTKDDNDNSAGSLRLLIKYWEFPRSSTGRTLNGSILWLAGTNNNPGTAEFKGSLLPSGWLWGRSRRGGTCFDREFCFRLNTYCLAWERTSRRAASFGRVFPGSWMNGKC